MRIYISIDMEGMPGTWNWDQERTDRASVKKAIYNHTADVIDAIITSDQNETVEEIVIADAHAAGDNLTYDITELDRRISLISGSPRPNYMMPVFSERFDMVFLLGYHAGYGRINANMDHTYSSGRIQSILINDSPMSETLINAAYAGSFGVPVTLISGDLALRESLKDNNHLPWVEFITTKEAIAKLACLNYSAIIVREETKKAVYKVLDSFSPKKENVFTFPSPVKLRIEFKSTAMADVACLMPYVNRLDGRTVEYTDDNFRVIFEAIMALTTLAYSVNQ